MSRSTLEWYEQLARGLVWAAAVVLVLAVVGAIITAGSDDALPLFEDVERQGRGLVALASLGGGVTAAGILAGLGAILRLLVSDRLDRLGSAADDEGPVRGEERRVSEGGPAASSEGDPVSAADEPAPGGARRAPRGGKRGEKGRVPEGGGRGSPAAKGGKAAAPSRPTNPRGR